jgi:hypothetical protein
MEENRNIKTYLVTLAMMVLTTARLTTVQLKSYVFVVPFSKVGSQVMLHDGVDTGVQYDFSYALI